MINIVETTSPNKDYCFYDEDGIFFLEIKNKDELVGTISVHKHPNDEQGGQVGLEISTKWRKRWLTKGLAKKMLDQLINASKQYNLTILYSVAFTDISPRLLEFFGFVEYYLKQPKTYYYLKLAR
tara:strand:+ start:19 stop:393 length:375 start_codon:yes stop_codon:yes gene_type:complete